MSIIKPKHANAHEYLREIQNDVLILFCTVHDEIDVIVDTKLLKPVMKKLADISSCKKVMDKVGYPYLNFVFDVEFSSKDSSWTAKDSIDIYSVPNSAYEHNLQKEFYELLSECSPKVADTVEQTSGEDDYFEISVDKLSNKLLSKLDGLPDGDVVIIVSTKEGSFEYDRKVDITDL